MLVDGISSRSEENVVFIRYVRVYYYLRPFCNRRVVSASRCTVAVFADDRTLSCRLRIILYNIIRYYNVPIDNTDFFIFITYNTADSGFGIIFYTESGSLRRDESAERTVWLVGCAWLSSRHSRPSNRTVPWSKSLWPSYVNVSFIEDQPPTALLIIFIRFCKCEMP